MNNLEELQLVWLKKYFKNLSSWLQYMHRWETRLLKQQTSITGTVYPLPTKENKLPFSVSSVFHTYSIYLYVYIYIEVRYICILKWQHVCSSIDIDIYICAAVTNGKRKRKPRRFSFIRLPFAYRANGSYPFANGSYPFANGLNGLAHMRYLLSQCLVASAFNL